MPDDFLLALQKNSGSNETVLIGAFFRCIFNKCINQSSIVEVPSNFILNNTNNRNPKAPYNGQYVSSNPVWNEALEWQFDEKTLKKLKRQGASIKLQCYLVLNWNPDIVTLPIDYNVENDENIIAYGYIVLDLKNALANGIRLNELNKQHSERNSRNTQNIQNKRQLPSKLTKLRNCKLVRNSIYPKIRVSFWCTLQPTWSTTDSSDQNTEKRMYFIYLFR